MNQSDEQNDKKNIHFYFLFSLNNSGTTIMSQYLNKEIKNSYLSKYGNHEGQNIPTVKDIMKPHRWDPYHHLDWEFIQNAWTKEALISGKSSFIEASPPNIIRVDKIINHFTKKSCIFSLSSPYHYVASSVRNYWNHVTFKEAIDITLESWTQRANIQRINMKNFPYIPFLSYDSFCKNPQLLSKALKIHRKTNAPNSIPLVPGKRNLPINEIVDMTPRHLAYLGLDGLSQINNYLNEKLDLLNHFGYEIITERKANRLLRKKPLLGQLGLMHRIKREQ